VQHKERGLVVLGVNTADDRKIALEYLKANAVTFPNILDTSDTANRAVSQYETLGMSAVPMTYVIDREGRVRQKHIGGRDWADPEILKSIEALL